MPGGMQRALDSLAPGFRTVRVNKFRSESAQYAAEASGSMQPLFAVVADIDGDGTLDAVMEGNSPGDSALRVIADFNGAKSRAEVITRIPLYDADAVGIYLSRPRGSVPGTFLLVDYPDSSTEYKYMKEMLLGTKIASN